MSKHVNVSETRRFMTATKLCLIESLQISSCVCMRVLTYRDNDRGDESPAHFEEERRRKTQHHLNISKVVPVTCEKKQKVIQGNSM